MDTDPIDKHQVLDRITTDRKTCLKKPQWCCLTVHSPACVFVLWQGTEVWAVQQVYQIHGRRRKGDPHCRPRALEEMHRPYVHAFYHTQGHTFTSGCNDCLYQITLLLCCVFCQHKEKKSSTQRVSCLSLHSFAERVPENRQSFPKPLLRLHQQWIPRCGYGYKCDIKCYFE